MALQNEIKVNVDYNIDIDFTTPQYITINAKQYDDSSRTIYITPYNNGNLYSNFTSSKQTAFIRFRKADGNYVYNFCDIDYRGRIIVELTGQMLTASGTCYAEVEVLNKGNVKIDANTGNIITIDKTARLATMTFYVYVHESVIDNSQVESSDVFFNLNDALNLLTADFSEAVQKAKSWAVGTNNIARENDETDNSKYYSQLSRSYAIGDANDIRSNEDTDNAKYYSEQSSDSADAAKKSEDNAKSSETNATTSESNAKTSETNAKTSETNAKASENASKTSETNAKTSETNAKTSETNADISEANALKSEQNSKTSETNAKTSETNALTSANKAQSYAVGGTNTRNGEDEDNALYYYTLTKNIVIGLDSGFIPMGTITFAELATVEKATGYVYNISDDFVTNSSFREGEGKSYTAGTNVYFCADGMLDCFGGASSPTATLSEVKEYLGI